MSKAISIFHSFCLILVLYLVDSGTARAAYFSLSPEYYLNGSADLQYVSDRTAANSTVIDASSLRQKYSLGLNGPIFGPLIGVFNTNGSVSKDALSANNGDASGTDYTFHGDAALFPTGKLRFSLYYDLARASSDATGSHSTFDSDNYGMTFSPRLFKGTTFLTYDHSSSTGNVTGTGLLARPFSDTQDRGTFFYGDDRRFESGGRLDYQYQLTLLRDDRNNQGSEITRNETDNRVLASYVTKIGDDTRWQNYLSGDVLVQKTPGDAASFSGTSFSVLYTSNLLHNFTRDVSGYLDLNHATLKTPFNPMTDTDNLTVTGTYANVPNPLPKMNLNLLGSVGAGREWETDSQKLNTNLTATSRWSLLSYFDILNDLAYSYQNATAATTGGAVSASLQPAAGATESDDALAYSFGLQGKMRPVNWFAGYTYQKLGLFTSPPGAGTSHTVTVGESVSGEKLFNQSDYSLTKTDIPGDDLHSVVHLLRSTTIYHFNRTLSMQLLPYLMSTTTANRGVESSATTGNLSLDLNWNPVPRLALTGGGDVGLSGGTGGDGSTYTLRGALRYIFPLCNINLSYWYKGQNQSTETGGFNSSESRVELTVSTSFNFRLGGFGPHGN